jgi:uncharacterized membrane protein
MNTGSKITGNTASSFSSNGGGVYVSGIFIMEGGEISGNENRKILDSSYGGGVHVDGGTFAMKGGKINDNTVYSSHTSDSCRSYGGGVYVGSGNFTMEGGEISGNTAYTHNTVRPHYSHGGGVYVGSGNFTMEGGEISGNTVTTYQYNYTRSSLYGGGVYVYSGTFSKTAAGAIVYGNNASPASLQNSAGGNGDAVYRSNGSKKRNSTIAANEAFNSSQNTGWDN